MHDQVAFLQIGEINVERRAGRQRVRRFEPARPLDFVASENFRVRDDNQLCFIADKAAGERADVGPKSKVKSKVAQIFLSGKTT
jgi:hypothetical protein